MENNSDNTSEEQFELADETLDTVAGGEGSFIIPHCPKCNSANTDEISYRKFKCMDCSYTW